MAELLSYRLETLPIQTIIYLCPRCPSFWPPASGLAVSASCARDARRRPARSSHGKDTTRPACGRGWVTTGTVGNLDPPYPVTNIPNTYSPRWRPWFSAENRCLVPANSFAEYARSRSDNKKTEVVWFGLLRRFPAPIGWARLRPGFVELGLKVKK